ncbi:MAG: hypothetical protein ACOYLX_17360 [Burkholderiaceae bacterium]
MAIDYYAGFDLSRIGPLTGSCAGTPFTLSTGRFRHDGLVGSTVDGYAPLAAALTAVFPVTYSIVWQTTLYRYRIVGPGGTFTWAPGTLAQQVLGFKSSSYSGQTTYYSDRRPYYLIKPSMTDRSDYSGRQQAAGIWQEVIADDGTPYGIGPAAAPIEESWSQRMEQAPVTAFPSATTATGGAALGCYTERGSVSFTGYATRADYPWTWEDFSFQCGTRESFFVEDGSTVVAYRLRADGASARPQRESGDLDNLWRIAINARRRTGL